MLPIGAARQPVLNSSVILDIKRDSGQRPRFMREEAKTSRIVERALALLEWLARHPGGHGVREIDRMLGMKRSTAHRLLGTLCRRGWVRQAAEDFKYNIGLKVLSLGSEVLSHITFLDAAGPIARRLAKQTGEAVYLGVCEAGRVVIIHKVGGDHGIRFDENVGVRAYVHSSALGKAILAGLDDEEVDRILDDVGLPSRTPASITDRAKLHEELSKIRRQGFAESDEENYIGALGIAAAIRDQSGEVVGALTVAGLKARMKSTRRKLARVVVDATQQISAELGYHSLSASKPKRELARYRKAAIKSAGRASSKNGARRALSVTRQASAEIASRRRLGRANSGANKDRPIQLSKTAGARRVLTRLQRA